MKKTVSVLLLFITLLFFGCSSNELPAETVETESTEEIIELTFKEYSSMIEKSKTDIMENTIGLYNLGKYEYGYWSNYESLGSTPVDFKVLTEASFEWLAENSEFNNSILEENLKLISSQYKEITFSNISNLNVEKISLTYDNMYTTYQKFYDLTMSPSGDIDSFSTNYNQYVADLKSYDSTLTTLLSE